MYSALLIAERNNIEFTALLRPRQPTFDDTASASP
jgi:hypothetical protein